MLCRIYTPGKVVISYKANVKELMFIRQGVVDVYNNEHDDNEIFTRQGVRKQKP
jgi:signal-transduction protein with cAMP-binding, CBS, and nucleotidyltransferase domain